MPCFISDISVKRNTCAFNENNGILYFFYKLIGKCYYMYLSLIHVYTNKDKHNHNPCIACQNQHDNFFLYNFESLAFLRQLCNLRLKPLDMILFFCFIFVCLFVMAVCGFLGLSAFCGGELGDFAC